LHCHERSTFSLGMRRQWPALLCAQSPNRICGWEYVRVTRHNPHFILLFRPGPLGGLTTPNEWLLISSVILASVSVNKKKSASLTALLSFCHLFVSTRKISIFNCYFFSILKICSISFS
jgi:hypothetical protein